MKRIPFYFLLTISLFLSQILVSRAMPTGRLRFSPGSSSNNWGLRTSFSENSSRHSHDFCIDYSQATAGWFKEFFQYTKPKEILNQYKLYEFKEFRRYIETV
ncbi:MAG: hypothetical protein WCD44_04555, partial [Candidatus Babeliales bacterium]